MDLGKSDESTLRKRDSSVLSNMLLILRKQRPMLTVSASRSVDLLPYNWVRTRCNAMTESPGKKKVLIRFSRDWTVSLLSSTNSSYRSSSCTFGDIKRHGISGTRHPRTVPNRVDYEHLPVRRHHNPGVLIFHEVQER